MKPSDVPVTLSFIGISVMVYLFMNIGNQEAIIRLFLISEYFQPVLPEIFAGQIWENVLYLGTLRSLYPHWINHIRECDGCVYSGRHNLAVCEIFQQHLCGNLR